jgi:hypothetical protein
LCASKPDPHSQKKKTQNLTVMGLISSVNIPIMDDLKLPTDITKCGTGADHNQLQFTMESNRE